MKELNRDTVKKEFLIADLIEKNLGRYIVEIASRSKWNADEADDSIDPNALHRKSEDFLTSVDYAIRSNERLRTRLAYILYSLCSLTMKSAEDGWCFGEPEKDAKTLMTFNQVVNAFCAFDQSVFCGSGEDTPISIPVVKSFCSRTTEGQLHNNAYAKLLLFVLGVFINCDQPVYKNNALKSFKTLCDIFGSISDWLKGLDKPVEMIELSEKIKKAVEFKDSKIETNNAYKGLSEIGRSEPDKIWEKLFSEKWNSFPENFRTNYRTQNLEEHMVESQDKRYLAYRYSSDKSAVKLVKSFVVFQSPGRILDHSERMERHKYDTNLSSATSSPNLVDRKVRDYFAIKVYTISSTGEAVMSAGAVTKLGKFAVAFAKRGKKKQLDEKTPELSPDSDFNGGAAFIVPIDESNFGEDILCGQLMATNTISEINSGNMILVPANRTHSDFSEIGHIPPEELLNDIVKFSTLFDRTVVVDGYLPDDLVERQNKLATLLKEDSGIINEAKNFTDLLLRSMKNHIRSESRKPDSSELWSDFANATTLSNTRDYNPLISGRLSALQQLISK